MGAEAEQYLKFATSVVILRLLYETSDMEEAASDAHDLPTCFVLSPIGSKGSEIRKEADKVLRHLIRLSLRSKFRIVRGDEDTNPGSITSSIVTSILEADLIVADLSGHNPNVFYEVAIAHGYHKPIVHIEKDGEKPPFDLQDMRLVTFDTTDPDSLDAARETLLRYAESAIARPEDAKTPLSNSQQFLEYSKSENPVENSMAELLGEVRELRSTLRGADQLAPDKGKADPDRQQFAEIINRLVNRGVVEPTDFKGVLNVGTTSRFDDWVKRVVQIVGGPEGEPEISRLVYDPLMFSDEHDVRD